jgi:phosphatidylserine decarboxylase
VILECLTKDEKLFYMVFVGALNVGQMAFNFDTTIATNTSQEATVEKSYENLTLTKGDELGYFKMGSTVVMIFEKDLVNLEVKTNQNIKFTEKIATRK